MSSEIVHIICPRGMGTAERVALEGARALAAQGAPVELIVLRDQRARAHPGPFFEALEEAHLPHKILDSQARLDERVGRALAMRWYDVPPAIVHAHDPIALSHANLTAPPKTRVVATHHGREDELADVLSRSAFLKPLYLMADLVLAPSDRAREVLRGTGRVEVVEPFVSVPTELAPRPPRPDPVRLLTWAHTRTSLQALELLLEALSTARSPRIHLTIAGALPEPGYLESVQRALKLNGQLDLQTPGPGFEEALGGHDALVVPAAPDNSELTGPILTALAHQRPVLAPHDERLARLIEHDEDGLLVMPRSARALRVGLIHLERHLERLRGSRAGRLEELLYRHSSERWARRTLTHYHQLVTERAPTRPIPRR